MTDDWIGDERIGWNGIGWDGIERPGRVLGDFSVIPFCFFESLGNR